jgi:hypothetical protein
MREIERMYILQVQCHEIFYLLFFVKVLFPVLIDLDFLKFPLSYAIILVLHRYQRHWCFILSVLLTLVLTTLVNDAFTVLENFPSVNYTVEELLTGVNDNGEA